MQEINLNDFGQMSDENLLKKALEEQNNNALECLIDRYKDVVNMKANKFFMVGSEKEDILQEGYIGLYKAVKGYDSQMKNSFKTFAGLCIERQIITAVKNSNRQKHIPLNSSLSLNAEAYDDDGDMQVIDVLDTRKSGEDPLDIITKKEYYSFVEKAIDTSLSDFEKKVLVHYKNGESYVQIAKALDVSVEYLVTGEDSSYPMNSDKQIKTITSICQELNYEQKQLLVDISQAIKRNLGKNKE